MLIPINDNLKKEDVAFEFSNSQKEKNFQIILNKYLQKETGDKFVYMHNVIAKHLLGIFNDFKIEENIINDLLIVTLSNVQIPILKTDLHSKRHKKNERELQYYIAYLKLIKSPILQKYLNIYNMLLKIEDFEIIERNILELERNIKENLRQSRTPINKTKFNFDAETQHLTKCCWASILVALLQFGIEEQRGRRLAVYILGYFQLIHRKHFKNSTSFNNFYKKSFYKKHQF